MKTIAASLEQEDSKPPSRLHLYLACDGPTLSATPHLLANSFIPKKVSLSFSFSVLHTHLTGWQKGSDFSTGMAGTFPNAVFLTSKKTVMTDSRAPDIETGPEMPQLLANEAIVLEDF